MKTSTVRGGASREDWQTLGWQGLTVRIPGAWNLVAYGGDAGAGSLRLDSGEPSALGALGLDLRWTTARGRVTEADLAGRLSKYLDSIERGARRQRLPATAQVRPISDPDRPERAGLRSFTWKADRRAVGRLWHCAVCRRVVIAQVVGGARANLGALGADVLGALACHPEDADWRTWSVYDLRVQVPGDYALQGRPQLMNVYVQLPFARAGTADTLAVEQWGVANLQLRRAALEGWFRDKSRAAESHLGYRPREAWAQGHPALALTGRRAGLGYWLSRGLPQVSRLRRPATYYEARVWECPESNKVYAVQSFSRRPQPEVVEQVVARTRCHL